MAVRYDKAFMAEINKVVKSYNAKITRLSKTNNDYVLPQKFTSNSLKALKASASSRADVRRRLKDLQSFTVRGGEKNITVGKTTIPRYQYINIKRYRRRLGIQTARKIKKYESTRPIANGKIQPFTFAQYGSRDYLTLKAKREALLSTNWETMTPREIAEYLDKLIVNTTEKVKDVWQENYLGILEDTALSYGYDVDKLEAIVSKLKSLTPEKFEELAFIDRNIQAILYSYKVLEDIQTADELTDVSGDVINNLDSIYENLDDIIAKFIG